MNLLVTKPLPHSYSSLQPRRPARTCFENTFLETSRSTPNLKRKLDPSLAFRHPPSLQYYLSQLGRERLRTYRQAGVATADDYGLYLFNVAFILPPQKTKARSV